MGVKILRSKEVHNSLPFLGKDIITGKQKEKNTQQMNVGKGKKRNNK